jgi:hypothetical protein
VNAGKIILATNGQAQNFGMFRGVLLHVYTYASMTEAFDPSLMGGERSWAATPAFPMGTTVRRRAVRGRSANGTSSAIDRGCAPPCRSPNETHRSASPGH